MVQTEPLLAKEFMRVSGKTTLKASLIGSGVGVAAWLSGLGNIVWHGHPRMAEFLLTIVATIVVMNVFAEEQAPASGSK
jgi:hypothetical protein